MVIGAVVGEVAPKGQAQGRLVRLVVLDDDPEAGEERRLRHELAHGLATGALLLVGELRLHGVRL